MTNFNVEDADVYLKNHQEGEKWFALDDDSKLALLQKAEMYINNTFDLRDGVNEELVYIHAIYEQAIHLLAFDKERANLQREGVVQYKVEDLSFQMNQSFISPITHSFLRKHIYKKVGKIS